MKKRKFQVTLEVEMEMEDYEGEGLVANIFREQLPDYIEVNKFRIDVTEKD